MIDCAWLYEWELRHVHRRLEQDVNFYADLTGAHPGSFLELACGTGRVGARLATAGVEVTGIDLDPTMLAVARSRAPTARWLQADMTDFDLDRRFAVVAIPYNSLQLLDDAGRAACLARAAAHLAEGGRLALEVTDFQADAATDDVPLTLLAEAEGVRCDGALTHDRAGRTTIYHRRLSIDGRARVDHVVLRSLGEVELVTELGAAGLALESVARDGYRLRAVALRALRTGDAFRAAGAGREGWASSTV